MISPIIYHNDLKCIFPCLLKKRDSGNIYFCASENLGLLVTTSYPDVFPLGWKIDKIKFDDFENYDPTLCVTLQNYKSQSEHWPKQ